MSVFDEYNNESNAVFDQFFNSGIGALGFPQIQGVSSPLLDMYQFKGRTFEDVKNLIFGNTRPIQLNIPDIEIIEDSNCDCGLTAKDFNIFIDKDKDGVFQKGVDELLYSIKVFVSRNVNDLNKAREICEPRENEIILYLEDNTDDLSDVKLFAEFGKGVDRDKLSNLNKESISVISKLIPDISPDIIKELILTGQYEAKSSFLKTLLKGLLYVNLLFGALGKALGYIVGKIGDLIKELSLSEKVWNSDSDAYVFKRDNMIDLLTIDLGRIESLMTQIKNLISTNKLLTFFQEKINPIIDQISQAIKGIVKKYNAYVTQFINDLYDKYEITVIAIDVVYDLTERIAFFAGLWNGIIDFIGGTLNFIGSVLELPFEVSNNFESILESFDTILYKIKNIDFDKVIKAFQETFIKMKLYFLKQNFTDVNQDKVAYVSGFGIAFVASLFVPFTQLIKITKVSNIRKLLPVNFLEEVSSKVDNVGNFLKDKSKKAADSVIKALIKVLDLFAKGKKAIVEFLDSIWKRIADWFLKNKKLFERKIKKPFRKIKKISKREVLDELGDELISALKKMGLSKNDILEYFIDYHNLHDYVFFNEIRALLKIFPNLTKTEALAIWGYTTNLFYGNLNAWLRVSENLAKTKAISKILVSGISKLPKYNGIGFRAIGLSGDDLAKFLGKHAKGKKVTYNEFVSMGSTMKAAFFNKGNKNIFLRIKVKDAPIISKFADGIKFRNYAKDELLLLPGKEFIVKNFVEKNGKYYIDLIQK